MKGKLIFSVLVTIALLLGMWLAAAPVGAVVVPETWYVSPTGDDTTGDGSEEYPWATINYAISQASHGDTIIVAAGTYGENIVIDKAVSLLGAQCNIDPAGSTERSGGESLIQGGQVEITAGATFNGFKLDGNRVFIHGASGAIASYNIIVNSTMHGVYIDGSSPGAQVVYNRISSPAWQGIVNEGSSNVIISYNNITGVDTEQPIECTSHAGTGIEISYNIIYDCTNSKGINYWGGDGATIYGNTISGTTWESIYLSSGHVDDVVQDNIIEAADYFAIYAGTRATITGNTINNSHDGIRVDYAGTGIGDRVEVIDNTVTFTEYAGINVTGAWTYIYDNTVHHCNYYGADSNGDWDYAAIHLESTATNCIVDGNTVYDSINGIQTWADNTVITNNEIYDMGLTYADEKDVEGMIYKNSAILIGNYWASDDYVDPTGIVIENNNIHDNYWGLFYRTGLTNGVNATKNWWGDASGPTHASNAGGAGDVISDNVAYDPYYDGEDMGHLAYTKSIYNTTQDIGYDTIQAAIDGADAGDTIEIHGGTYEVDSTIIVDESVTICRSAIGTDPAVVIGQNSTAVPVFRITADNVIIENLDITLTADAVSDYGVQYDGLIHAGVKKEIEYLTGIQILNNRIFVPSQGDRDTMSMWGTFGIKFERGCTAIVTGNTIYNTRQGISGSYGSALVVTENTIYNTKGGVCIYTTIGDIANHTIADNSWDAPDSALSHSEWDIVWHSGGDFSTVTDWDTHYQTYVLDLSIANNNAYVCDWRQAVTGKATTNNRSHVFVYDGDVNGEGGVTTPMNSINTAIIGTFPGGQVVVAAGEYAEVLNLQDKSLTLRGAGVDSTIIDASAFTGYAVHSFGNSTTIKDLALIGTGESNSSYGFKVSHVSDITFENVKVVNSYRTSFDLNTVTGAILTNIEAADTVAGFGLMILDSTNVDVTNVTTSNNTWGGVSVQTVNAPTDGVTFTGFFNASEDVPLLLEKDPPTYPDITNVTIPGQFTHIVYAQRSDGYRQFFYRESLEEAKAFALALAESTGPFTYTSTAVYDITESNYYVVEGLLIQDAINAADAGDTIIVAAGTYNEAVSIPAGSDLSLIGAGRDAVNWVAPPGTACISCDLSGYTGTTILEIAGFNFSFETTDTSHGAGLKIYGASSGPLYLDVYGNAFFGTTETVAVGNTDNSMWLCHNRHAVRTNGDAPVKIHNNIDQSTGGICMSNSLAFDIYENTFDGCSDALHIAHGCPTGTTIGDHHIYGNVFKNADNEIMGSTTDCPSIYFGYWGDPAGMTFLPNTIEENTFEDNDIAIGYYMWEDISPSDIIRYNNFINNQIGVDIGGDHTPAIDATHNWWGTAVESEIAGMVSGNVDFDPWHLKALETTTVDASKKTTTSVILTWTAEGTWPEDYYDFRYSTAPIVTETEWNSARRITGEPAPIESTAQEMIVRNLNSNTTYYFGLAITDGTNRSEISIVEATTDAVAVPDTTPPAGIADLHVMAGTPPTTSVILTWTASGDDGTDGFASKYIIKRSLNPIDEDNWNAATTIFNSMVPQASGQTETFTVTRLTPDTTYYFAIKVQDEIPNTSAISNVVNMKTANVLPAVTGITPGTGDNGEARTLTITGTNFLTTGTTTVRLVSTENVLALTNASTSSGIQLTAVVPKGVPTGIYNARVINDNGTSALSTVTYTVTAAPTPLPVVTNAIPNLAASNTPVTGVKIFGQNFTDATGVTINGVAASDVTVNSDTKITVNVPGLEAGEYDIKVTTPAGTNDVSTVKFIVNDPITVDNETKDTTTSGVVNTITGTIPVQVTMTTSTSETPNTDTDAEVSVVIPPGTNVTGGSGIINPPRVVKPDEEAHGTVPDDAIVLEMGDPNETINFDKDLTVTVRVEAAEMPKIYYLNKTTGKYELAGKTGTVDGINYVPGGVELAAEPLNGMTVYTIGLLIDHMSTFVASSESLLEPEPTPPAPAPVVPPAPTPTPEPPPGTTDIRGVVSAEGRFTETVRIIAFDEALVLEIPAGTVGLTKDLEPLAEITIVVAVDVPAPPAGAHVIGLAWDFGPDGAVFDPAANLTILYDLANLAAGVAEEDLVVAWYNAATGSWEMLETTVDTINRTVTAKVSHFSTFAIVGTESEPAVTPTEPAVTPTEPAVTPTEPAVTPTEPAVTPTEPAVTPTEPAVTPTEPKDGGIAWYWWLVIGIGAVVLVALGVLTLRRRRD